MQKRLATERHFTTADGQPSVAWSRALKDYHSSSRPGRFNVWAGWYAGSSQIHLANCSGITWLKVLKTSTQHSGTAARGICEGWFIVWEDFRKRSDYNGQYKAVCQHLYRHRGPFGAISAATLVIASLYRRDSRRPAAAGWCWWGVPLFPVSSLFTGRWVLIIGVMSAEPWRELH